MRWWLAQGVVVVTLFNNIRAARAVVISIPDPSRPVLPVLPEFFAISVE